MSKYKVGDKFVIEIGAERLGGPTLYRIKGFNTLVFDDDGLDRLERYEANQNEITVGDEIQEDGDNGVMTYINPARNDYFVMWFDGSCGKVQKHKITKTGKHYPIEDILKQMRGE